MALKQSYSGVLVVCPTWVEETSMPEYLRELGVVSNMCTCVVKHYTIVYR